ncbi:hypothetical protein JOD45_002431 [Scopulibacillus daqui]|uniref:Uncharacterized protein n=1 Tax=Scopulibacillus daqui TaxID=1469162 RepID=A0ABS2Q1Q2_9BACL|nr:hypothetical protein [Scopulibacillus daqui]
MVFKPAIAVASLISLIIYPIFSVGIIFYYIFMGRSTDHLLFNSLSVVVSKDTSFSFSFKPHFFLIAFVLFVISFLIALIFTNIKKDS